MTIDTRKTIVDDLTKYCYLADKDEVVEVTRWTNGEGVDVYFSNSDEMISLSYGKIEAINFLSKCLTYCEKED